MISSRIQIPINPSLLIWARETAGYSLEQLIDIFPKLKEWESGNGCPTYSKLEDLAKKYHRPLAVFFFPSPPQEETIEKSFRAISANEIQNLSPRIRFLFRKAKSFQYKLQELLEDQSALQRKKIEWLNDYNGSPSAILVDRVRNVLNISIQDQLEWKNDDVALKKWREVLANNGIYVFKEAFKDDKFSGFCIYDELFPIIFINNSHSKNRQIFTIFHELAHLIFHNSYLDSDYQFERINIPEIEVKCNNFATQFLMPDDHFLMKYKNGDLSDRHIVEIADYFKVSKYVVLRRMLDKNIISSAFYQSRISEWDQVYKNSKPKKKSGGNQHYSKMSYLGDAYISLVFGKYYTGRLNLEKASEYLDIPVKSFSGIEEKLFSRRQEV